MRVRLRNAVRRELDALHIRSRFVGVADQRGNFVPRHPPGLPYQFVGGDSDAALRQVIGSDAAQSSQAEGQADNELGCVRGVFADHKVLQYRLVWEKATTQRLKLPF